MPLFPYLLQLFSKKENIRSAPRQAVLPAPSGTEPPAGAVPERLARSRPGQRPHPGQRPPGSQRLAAEERLGLPAHGVDAERAAQRQLAGAHLVGLQVGAHQVCQGLQGGWERSEGTDSAVQSPRPNLHPVPLLTEPQTVVQ